MNAAPQRPASAALPQLSFKVSNCFPDIAWTWTAVVLAPRLPVLIEGWWGWHLWKHCARWMEAKDMVRKALEEVVLTLMLRHRRSSLADRWSGGLPRGSMILLRPKLFTLSETCVAKEG